MCRVLILTADTGAGHRAVARALAGELAALSGGTVSPLVANVFALAAGRAPVEQLVQRGYAALICQAPSLWGALYNLTYHRRAFDVLTAALGGGALRRMARLLDREEPALIVATHPLALFLAARALCARARRGGTLPVPLWAVVTDLVSVHPAWVQPGVERYVVGSAEGATVLARWGIPAGQIALMGLPIGRAFGALRPLHTPDAAPPRLRTVLVMGGGEGAGGLVEIVRAILGARLGVEVIAVCGRNWVARRALAAVGAAGNLHVFGYVDDMAALVARADVIVTKAGSVTVAEAAAAARPLIIAAALPGQEQGNPALVARYGAGIVARGPGQVVAALRLLRDEPARLAALAAGCRRLARPEAASSVAQALLERLGPAGGAPPALQRGSRAADRPPVRTAMS